MFRLIKYLKPFIGSLFLAVVLLFIQAQADLNLPHYLSDIVNIGIMNNGIHHATPEVITPEGYAFAKAMLPTEQQDLLDANFELIPSGQSLKLSHFTLTDYPAVYQLKSPLDAATQTALDEAFGAVPWTLIKLGQLMGQTTPSLGSGTIDIAQMYQFTTMVQNPQLAGLLSTAKTDAMAVDSMTKSQTGIIFIKNIYYKELNVDVQAIQLGYILETGFWMLVITLIGALAMILVALISSQIGAGVARNLRKDVFQKVESFSSEEFNSFSTSSLITRTTNDITQLQQLVVLSIRMIFYAPIIAAGGVWMIFQTNVSMTWIIGAAVVALVLMIAMIFSVAIPKFKLIQKLIDRLNLVAREGLTGLLVIRAFGNQEFDGQRFDKANKDLAQNTLFVNRVINFMMPGMTLIMNGTIVAIIWFGSKQIAASQLMVGDMLAFINYSMQVIMSFLMISMMFIFLPRAAVSANRVAEVLYLNPKIVDPKDPTPTPVKPRGVVKFDHVSFRFGNADEKVLSDISFVAKPGQTTAIIGSTGSGKSTLINLIPRFYDVTEGSISIDGIDIRQYTQYDLHNLISYVPQKGMILSGTIESNLRYGKPDASEEEIRKAAEISQAQEFIEEKEGKFQSAVAQGGANVSGGQKQRLSIARALIKKAPIIIFDDSFSALDFKTDQRLRKAMQKEVKDATLIIVAQRVGTIMNADQIIVLDQGKIVAQGTHSELLKTSTIYYEIASSQLAKEELANVRK